MEGQTASIYGFLECAVSSWSVKRHSASAYRVTERRGRVCWDYVGLTGVGAKGKFSDDLTTL